MGNVKNKPLSLDKQKEAAKDFESPKTERKSAELRLALKEKRRKQQAAKTDRTASGDDKQPRTKKVA